MFNNGCYLHISCLVDRKVQVDDKDRLAAAETAETAPPASAAASAAAAAAGGKGGGSGTSPDLLVTGRFM